MVVDGCLIYPHLFCNPVLGDAKAVHSEYLDVRVHRPVIRSTTEQFRIPFFGCSKICGEQ